MTLLEEAARDQREKRQMPVEVSVLAVRELAIGCERMAGVDEESTMPDDLSFYPNSEFQTSRVGEKRTVGFQRVADPPEGVLAPKNGLHITRGDGFRSAAHTDEDITRLSEFCEAAMEELRAEGDC